VNVRKVVLVRDSKAPRAGTLTFEPATWDHFVRRVVRAD
jgi:hypothetical protein